MRVFTDGSCLGNPGPGGWAWAVSKDLYNSGHFSHTTNQQMELKAVQQALKHFQSYLKELVIVTDSAYIVNCFKEKWYKGWTEDGTKIRTGEKVINWDLWKSLFELGAKEVTFEKVKGHSGDEMNDFVDELAVAAARYVKGGGRRVG